MSGESISGRHDSQALIIGMGGAIAILFAFALCVCFAGCTGYRRYHDDQIKRRKFVNSNIPSQKYDKEGTGSSNGVLPRNPTSTGDDSNQIREIQEAAPPLVDRQDENTCSICLVQFKKGDKISWSTNNEANCSHTYHTKCIKEWLYKHKECPMCREMFLWEEPSNEEENDARGDDDVETGTRSALDSSDLARAATVDTEDDEEEVDA